jgi:Family of unknown function (DUF5989)
MRASNRAGVWIVSWDATAARAVVPSIGFSVVDTKKAEEKSSMARSAIVSLASEFWAFLRVRKKWWLAPIIIVMALFGGLIVFTQGSALAPFVYTIF